MRATQDGKLIPRPEDRRFDEDQMDTVYRYAAWLAIVCVPVVLAAGSVAATSESSADPQPGFGVVLAMVAILVALLLARHKRQQYG